MDIPFAPSERVVFLKDVKLCGERPIDYEVTFNFEEATHALFPSWGFDPQQDDLYQDEIVKIGTLAFQRAYIRHVTEYQQYWLGCQRVLRMLDERVQKTLQEKLNAKRSEFYGAVGTA